MTKYGGLDGQAQNVELWKIVGNRRVRAGENGEWWVKLKEDGDLAAQYESTRDG